MTHGRRMGRIADRWVTREPALKLYGRSMNQHCLAMGEPWVTHERSMADPWTADPWTNTLNPWATHGPAASTVNLIQAYG